MESEEAAKLMSEIKKLNKSLSANKGTVTKSEKSIRKFFSAGIDINNEHLIKSMLRKHEDKLMLMRDLSQQIIELYNQLDTPETDEVSKKFEKDFDVYAEQVEDDLIIFHKNCVIVDKEKVKPIESSSALALKVSLPKLHLPKFNGNILSWTSFYQQFQLNIGKAAFSNVQKLSYLFSLLEGDALECIRNMAIEEENYAIAMDTLIANFGRKEKIINRHLEELKNLPPASYTPSSLRTFRNLINSNLRVLSDTYKINVMNDKFLVTYMTPKIPEKIRTEMARLKKPYLWTMEDIINGVSTEIEVLDVCDPIMPSVESSVFYTAQNRNSGQYQGKINQGASNNYKKLPVNQNPTSPCYFCNQNHRNAQCNVYKTPQEKYSRVRELKLCLNCLKADGHFAKDCPNKAVCWKCKELGKFSRHNTLLCYNINNVNVSYANTQNIPMQGSLGTDAQFQNSEVLEVHQPISSQDPGSAAAANIPEVHVDASFSNCPVMLQTANVMVSSNESFARCGALLDTGSMRTFISKELAKNLSCEVVGSQIITLSVFGSNKQEILELEVVKIFVKCIDDSLVEIFALVSPKLSLPIQHLDAVDLNMYPSIKNLEFARDLSYVGTFNVELLIGADNYFNFVTSEFRKTTIDGPIAQSSRLGWLLAGPVSTQSNNVIITNVLNVLIDKKSVQECVQKFFSLESIGINDPNDIEEFNFKDYVDSIQFDKATGHYRAPLPWLPDHPELVNNLNYATARCKSVISKLIKDGIFNDYSDIIAEQLRRGFIEPLPDYVNREIGFFICHHGVVSKSISTPLRIVYDCSASTKDSPSLNSCLEKGPRLQNDIVKILLNFRIGEYGILSDIEKAFHAVLLNPDDTLYTQFLWLEDMYDPNSKLIPYRFIVLPFGVKPSPFVLGAVIYKHLMLNPCEIAEIIKKRKYVDNIINAINGVKMAIKFYYESREIFKSGGFNLRQFVSNCSELNECAKADSVFDDRNEVSVLGLLWSVNSDMLSVKKLEFKEFVVYTKRMILSMIARVYDPLGFLTPISIKGKLFLQSLFKIKVSWDYKLPTNTIEDWILIMRDLELASEFSIPRMICHTLKDFKLHAFCDSSPLAYGAVIYLVSEMGSFFVFSKSKVAPIRPVTIPKLELTSAGISCRMVNFVKNALDVPDIDCKYWSDSQVTLFWLNTNADNLKRYVKERVIEIQKNSNVQSWKYVPSLLNPSDLITKGVLYKDLKENSLWLRGPEFLIKGEEFWPKWNIDDVKNDLSLFAQVTVAFNETTIEKMNENKVPLISDIIDIKRFSSLDKLLRTTCFVLRAFKTNRNKGFITVQELDHSRNLWYRACQLECFSKEINLLSVKRRNQLINQLDLYVEEKTYLLKSRGRIGSADLPENTLYPIVLPYKHEFSKLLVLHTHKLLLHAGVQLTMVEIRKNFWIPKLRQLVRNNLSKCVNCRKISGTPYMYPKTPELPDIRVKDIIPFNVCGVDFSGDIPIYSDNLISVQKGYIALFTCMVTRALHLELVQDMSVESFFLAFRRFCGRRSVPSMMLSDNAKSFESASRNIQSLLSSQELMNNLSKVNCQWIFIPKKMPWCGGSWERLIGLSKNLLKKVLGRSKLSFIALQTLLVEIELVLNNRPLTYLTSERSDVPEILTPSMLMYGKTLNLFPYPVVTPDDLSDPIYSNVSRSALVHRAKYRALLYKCFVDRFKADYLTSLREKHSSKGSTEIKIKIGSVVLIHDESNRLFWNLGVVEKLNYGRDGLVRSVFLRTKFGVTTRPIIKLYPLEVYSDYDIPSEPKSELQVQSNNERPSRKAKDIANLKISELFNE